VCDFCLLLTSSWHTDSGIGAIATIIAVVAFPGVGVVGGKETKVAVVSSEHAAIDEDKDEEIGVQTTSNAVEVMKM